MAKTASFSARMYYLVQYTAGDVQELMRSCLAMDSEGIERLENCSLNGMGSHTRLLLLMLNA